MNKLFVLSTIIAVFLFASCTSTKRLAKNEISSDLRQKIENRDFKVVVEVVHSDINVDYIKLRSLRISGDHLISDIGEPFNIINPNTSLLYSKPRSKEPEQLFTFEIRDYKVKDIRKNRIEVTFNHEVWNMGTDRLEIYPYRMIINRKGEVKIYIDGGKYLDLGQVEVPMYIADYKYFLLGKIELVN